MLNNPAIRHETYRLMLKRSVAKAYIESSAAKCQKEEALYDLEMESADGLRPTGRACGICTFPWGKRCICHACNIVPQQ